MSNLALSLLAAASIGSLGLPFGDHTRQPAGQIAPRDTKWCGPGNLANGFEDLGSERQTDMCCRQHDFCPDYIGAYKTNETLRLTNRAGYSRLSCSCDYLFHDCLKKQSSLAAVTIRKIYFNFIQTKCFEKDYPLQCVATKGTLVKKCLQYDKNNNTEMVYQWVDLKSLR